MIEMYLIGVVTGGLIVVAGVVLWSLFYPAKKTGNINQTYHLPKTIPGGAADISTLMAPMDHFPAKER